MSEQRKIINPIVAGFDSVKYREPIIKEWNDLDAYIRWAREACVEREILKTRVGDQNAMFAVSTPIHYEVACLKAQNAMLVEALEIAKGAMDERRGYVNSGDPGLSWEEMKYGDLWDEEDAKVSSALAAVNGSPNSPCQESKS